MVKMLSEQTFKYNVLNCLQIYNLFSNLMNESKSFLKMKDERLKMKD